MGAVVNTAKVQVGDNVVVFGIGGIGLNVIQGAKLAGAGRVVGVDINPARKEWGRTDVPKIVDWYMDGKIQIDPMITHILSLEEINKGFDLSCMRAKASAASWSFDGNAVHQP